MCIEQIIMFKLKCCMQLDIGLRRQSSAQSLRIYKCGIKHVIFIGLHSSHISRYGRQPDFHKRFERLAAVWTKVGHDKFYIDKHG
jgi:hypothetical protein